MNTSSLAGIEMTRKASEVRKKIVKFSNQNVRFTATVPLLCNPVNTNQARLKWLSIRNAQEKAKEKGGKRERERRKTCVIKSQKKKKNKK